MQLENKLYTVPIRSNILYVSICRLLRSSISLLTFMLVFSVERSLLKFYIIIVMKVAQSCPTFCDPMDYTIHGILRPEYRSGQPFPSPGDLPNPETEPSLLHCRWIFYQLSHKGSPYHHCTLSNLSLIVFALYVLKQCY